jgi:hypothetical protein
MVKRGALRSVGLAASVAAVACACDALIGLHDPVEIDDAAADGGARSGLEAWVPVPPGASPDVQSGTDCADMTMCHGQCVDLATNALNCGQCQHQCLGTDCVGGLCRPATLTHGDPVRGVIGGTSPVWMTDHAVFTVKIALNGSAQPEPTLLFATDAGPLRSVVGGWGGVDVAVAPGDDIVELLVPPGPKTIAEDAGDPLSLASGPAGLWWASSDPSVDAITGASAGRDAAASLSVPSGSRPCSLATANAGVAWTSAYGTFLLPPGADASIQLTPHAFDYAVVPSSGSVIVAENGDRFDLTIFQMQGSAPPEAAPLVVAAHARAVVISDPTNLGAGDVYFASEGIFRTDSSGTTPVLLAAGAVPDECHVPQMALTDEFVVWVDRDTQQLMYVLR